MPLTILHVGYPFAPIGPDAAGGAEQVLTLLHEGLTRRGLRSIALEGERPDEPVSEMLRARVHLQYRRRIEAALREQQVDIVHMHGIDCADYLPPPCVPTLITLHLPIGWYPPGLIEQERASVYFNCVSESQARRAPPSRRMLPPVANGIDVAFYSSEWVKDRFAIALGRICPEKGFHHALNAAQAAGIRLALAGEVFPYPDHMKYFHDEIAPRLDSQRSFLGPIGKHRKRVLLGTAFCTLIPSLAAETSCLVAMESLASGTPVIAFPSGALPDLIDHGVTGFLAADEREMAVAIGLARDLDPDTCRRVARERFSADGMVEGYISLYRRMLDLAGGRG
jgi:glycosyltransferase involved in cell wall biosynthesis